MIGFELNYEMTLFLRLVFAGILGGLIGFEREIHGRPAGFRTHMLVSLGACLMMVISEYFAVKYGMETNEAILRLDPSRVAAQIVTGIGFLGAGAIIKEGATVRGLTTAACLWVSAGIGMAVGTGLYFGASAAAGLSLVALLLMKKVDSRIRKKIFRLLTVRCSQEGNSYENLTCFLEKNNIEIVSCSFVNSLGKLGKQDVVYNFTLLSKDAMAAFPIDAIRMMDGVEKVSFR